MPSGDRHLDENPIANGGGLALRSPEVARDFLEIPGYHPTWITDPAEFCRHHERSLAALLGARVESTWALWDLDDDSHFDDAPVVVRFAGGRQVEVCCNKFDEVSVTFNTIDLDRTVVWEWVEPKPFRLDWREGALPPLSAVVGHALPTIGLLEIELVILNSARCLGGLDLSSVTSS